MALQPLEADNATAKFRPAPLAAALCALMTIGTASASGIAPRGSGPIIVVEDCNEDGQGSLSDAVSGAPEDSTIDLTQLTCSTISLATGSSTPVISVGQDDLNIVGPGADELTIESGIVNFYPQGRVFNHSGVGTLSIEGVTIANGEYTDHYDAPPRGGCIYSEGSVYLGHSRVTGCLVTGADEYVAGGGVFAKGSITAKYSTIDHNVAYNESYSDDRVSGGGLYSLGGMRVKYSTISHNLTDNDTTPNGSNYGGTGGGLFAFGDVTILSSTINNNYAKAGAGTYFRALGSSTVGIRSSTISGNFASGEVGGVFVNGGGLTMYSSTIAFNYAEEHLLNGHAAYAGLHLRFADANVQSSIIAENFSRFNVNEWANSDFSVYGPDNADGDDNLVITGNVGVGATISDDPKLLPLRDNGGPTWTHALAADSPALDTGNNVTTVCCDQRGFARVVGAGPDIGAFEKQGPFDGDRIFADGFD